MSVRTKKLKNVIRYWYLPCGIFFSRNIAGDNMETVYQDDGVTVDACFDYEYLEVFGLNAEEEREITRFYNGLAKRGEDPSHPFADSVMMG